MFLISALVFSLLIAVFAVQNAVQVTVTILFWNFPISLVLVILGSAALGALIMFSVAMFRQFYLARKIKESEARVKQLEVRIQECEGRLAARQAQGQEGP